MKNKSYIISIIAVIAALGIGYMLPKNGNKSQTIKAPGATSKEEHNEASDIVELNDNDAKSAGIETAKINFGTGSEIRILGRVMAAPEAKIMVGAPISGRVSRVYVAAGSMVNKGTPLFEIISAEGAGIVADARAANANVNMASASANAAQSAYSSDEFLYAKGVISRRELENSKASAISANANVAAQSAYANAAHAKVGAAGAPSANGAIIIRAPITGIVNNMPISVGGFVPQGAMAGEITNVDNTEAVFQIAPNLLEKVSIGTRINFETNDGRLLSATIKAIAPGIDAGANNSIIRAKIEGASLAVGTVINARIVSQNGAQNLRPIVPNDAINSIGDAKKVFVKTDKGYRAVSVIIGNSFSGQTEIISGLKGDEIIVIKNAFLLKSQLAKSELEEE
ncbi:MAG: efflux RND transporter periplasmic adaptor subunit [Proteobacteria bacterium]|nr:efflux RND transporter periplasmic adaptor subunit [Pseudomonadota bacterium]